MEKTSMNLFYLIGGLICLFLAVAHALWGEKEISSELKESNLSELTKAGFYISYHQITITLLVNGIALVIISIFDTVVGIDFLAILVIGIIIGNISVFILISLTNYRSTFKQTIPQTIIFGILVILIILGIIF